MASYAYPTQDVPQETSQRSPLTGPSYGTITGRSQQTLPIRHPQVQGEYDFSTAAQSSNSLLSQFPDPHADPRQGFSTTHIQGLHSGQSARINHQIVPPEIRSHLDHRLRPQVEHPSALFRPQFHGHPRHIPPSVPAGPGYSYASAPRTRFGDQQSDPRRRYQMQINYLDSLTVRIIPSLHAITPELQSKESLRWRLINIAREAISFHASQRGLSAGSDAVDFKCFGSLRNGFGLPGADMDLAMTTRASSFPQEMEDECPRILEKAFLDAGFGARLIGKTRVPIIKLCERPSPELLDALREERRAWEIKQLATAAEDNDSKQRVCTSSESISPEHMRTDDRVTSQPAVSVDFPGSDTGIHCDINFSGNLAIYNSELLRCYSLCDERVRLVGIFVKKWAKSRKINSSYRGTLCSYGYILMVIHYLINVAQPPLIPNLQIDYRPPSSGRKGTTTVSGYDVRFFNDEESIRSIARTRGFSRNNQTIGELVRGFFAYYGGRGRNAPLGGFDWVNGVISIRTRGGILAKSDKGWTSLRVDDNGNRHRYLLAIEDPFEVDYNVARTVVRDGLLAIRAEFYRANEIINGIQEIPGAGWQWRTKEGNIGEDFFAEAEERLYLQRHRQRADQTGENSSKVKSSSPTNPRSSTELSPERRGNGSPHNVFSPGRIHEQSNNPTHIPTKSLAYRYGTKQNTIQSKCSIPEANQDEMHVPLGQDEVQSRAADAISGGVRTGASTKVQRRSSLQNGLAKSHPFRTVGHAGAIALPERGKSICEVNPLIRCPVSEVTRKQEQMDRLFARDAASAAGKLNSILENQKAHAFSLSNTAKESLIFSSQSLLAVENVVVSRDSEYVDNAEIRDKEPLGDNNTIISEGMIHRSISSSRDIELFDSDSVTIHSHLSNDSDAVSIPSLAFPKPHLRSVSPSNSQGMCGDSNISSTPRGLIVDPRQLYETHSMHTGNGKAVGARAQTPFSHNSNSMASQMLVKDENSKGKKGALPAELLQNLPFGKFIAPSDNL